MKQPLGQRKTNRLQRVIRDLPEIDVVYVNGTMFGRTNHSIAEVWCKNIKGFFIVDRHEGKVLHWVWPDFSKHTWPHP